MTQLGTSPLGWHEYGPLYVGAPEIIPIYPLDGDVKVPSTKPIFFKAADPQGIDLGSVEIKVRDVVVFAGGEWAEGWESSVYSLIGTIAAPTGYYFCLVPPTILRWLPGEVVRVAVALSDTDGYTADRTWSFTAEGVMLPADIYKMILGSVRKADEQGSGHLRTLCDGLNDVWYRCLYARADALQRDLYDPDTIDAQFLPYQKAFVGFSRDLVFQATENELRKIIANGAAFFNLKPSEASWAVGVRMVTGNRYRINDFFDLRMQSDVTLLSELQLGYDPHIFDLSSRGGSVPSEFCSELRIIDDLVGQGAVDRELLRFLLNLVRVSDERIDIVYLYFLDQFLEPDDLNGWNYDPLVTIPEPGGALVVPAGTWAHASSARAPTWADQSTVFAFTADTAATKPRLRFFVQNAGDFYYVEVDYTARVARLYRSNGGVPTLLGTSAVLPHLVATKPDTVRVDALRVPHAPADYTFIRVKVDGEVEIEATDSSGANFLNGSVGVYSDGGTTRLTLVEVLPVPADVDRVGLNP